MRKLKFIEEYVDFLEGKRLFHERQFHQHGAVSRILTTYRLYQLKKRLFNMLFWMKYTKAIVIQRLVRGFITRLKHKSFRAAKAQREKLERESAIIIQKLFRRSVAERKLFERMEAKARKKEQHHQEKLFKLAEGIPPAKKFHMFFLRMYRSLRPFRYLVLNEKAAIIQRVYRGFHGRKRIQVIKIHAHLQKFYASEKLKARACLRIQRVWRGYNTRYEPFLRILALNFFQK